MTPVDCFIDLLLRLFAPVHVNRQEAGPLEQDERRNLVICEVVGMAAAAFAAAAGGSKAALGASGRGPSS